jgi:hypothetical protein
MSRQVPAARAVAPGGPLRWDATPAQMGLGGSCEWVSGASVSSNPSFSAAC